MKKQNFRKLHHEKGMSTLVIILLLLFVATLVTLYTANSMVREQQVSANQYRSDKALSTANAGLDYAVAYYAENSGPDADNDKKVDALTVEITDKDGNVLTDMSGNNLVTVTFTDGDPLSDWDGDGDFDNDAFERPHRITSIGTTEDSSAQRTISVEVDLFGVIPSGGLPGFPLVAKGVAGSWGNFTIINRYSNATIWTGSDTTTIGSSETFIADPNDIPTNHCQYVSFRHSPACPGDPHNADITQVLHASYNQGGLNSDVIENDINLSSIPDDDFFRNFMREDKQTVKAFAEGINQVFDGDDGANPVAWNDLEVSDGVKGLVWIDGDFTTNGSLETIGSNEYPMTLIIDGDFDTGGSGKNSEVTLIGLIYVIGNWSSGGNFVVQGGAIVEGDVHNNGTPTIIYDDALYDGGLGTPPGSIAAIRAGTWKDW